MYNHGLGEVFSGLSGYLSRSEDWKKGQDCDLSYDFPTSWAVFYHCCSVVLVCCNVWYQCILLQPRLFADVHTFIPAPILFFVADHFYQSAKEIDSNAMIMTCDNFFRFTVFDLGIASSFYLSISIYIHLYRPNHTSSTPSINHLPKSRCGKCLQIEILVKSNLINSPKPLSKKERRQIGSRYVLCEGVSRCPVIHV